VKEGSDMKILNLESVGFRSLKNISWVPGNLNVVIGPNGAGKSNLLKLIELISISAKGGLGKHIQKSGGMESLVWDGMENEIRFKIKLSPVDEFRDIARDSLTYELVLQRIGKTSSYRVSYELLANFFRVEQGERQNPFKFLERTSSSAVTFDPTENGLKAPDESVSEDESLLSLSSGPLSFNYNPIIPQFRSRVSEWVIYHDIYVNQDAPIRQAATTKFEKRVSSDGQNLISVLHTLYTSDRDFKKEINSAMRAAFGNDFDELIFPPAADQRTQLRIRWKTLQKEQSAADLSDGTLRFLFLLTVLSSPDPAPLIAIDEPETGLHPSMLPIVAEFAAEASKKALVIFTTHSPQFLDAFAEFCPHTTVAKWANGETELKVLAGEKLDYWLKEYSLGSLFKTGELEGME